MLPRVVVVNASGRAPRSEMQQGRSRHLLQDLSRVRLLPLGFMCASTKRDDYTQQTALLPTFMLPRACMGIVCQFFLRYQQDPANFTKELCKAFPCCICPKEDLRIAFAFWDDLRRCVDEIASPLGAEELAEDMKVASNVLRQQQKRLGLWPDKQIR
eukprot:gnl/TRDRNA2_/TRDRNA2_160459_c0_seq1.p1 gnl/TRDRNA2_/TRDRNA2_160459_c0~~gnl/TRDRNA2_/TRDRNA2_160459_c0_seq1.p1  ORF type:complete len:157 (-),score=26.27 gnl/TRDRNA2_/TRDRNA2_160459_c0_seq1:77-547(-)